MNTIQHRRREIVGSVRSETGEPVEGVLVVADGLGYSETNAEGNFRIQDPELALFFWCTGFYPRTVVLRGETRSVDVTLRAVSKKAAAATAR